MQLPAGDESALYLSTNVITYSSQQVNHILVGYNTQEQTLMLEEELLYGWTGGLKTNYLDPYELARSLRKPEQDLLDFNAEERR